MSDPKLQSGRTRQHQDGRRCQRVDERTRNAALSHRFERTITVPRFGQTSGVQQQEVLRAKYLPLDYVDKFVEVQGFISSDGTPSKSASVLPAARIPSREGSAWRVAPACHRRRAPRFPRYPISRRNRVGGSGSGVMRQYPAIAVAARQSSSRRAGIGFPARVPVQ